MLMSRLVLCLPLLFVAGFAFAQDRHPLELSGGYQNLIDIDEDADVTTFKNGMSAAAAWNITRRLAAVGEFTRSSTTIEQTAPFPPTERTVFTTMGGVRLRFGGLFVQALIGQLAVRTHEERLLGTLDETVTDMAVQPGIGVDFAQIGRISGRVQVDYRKSLSDPSTFRHQFRVGTGAVVGIGAR